MKPAVRTQTLAVCIGQAGTPVGRLSHARQGQREFSAFAYDTQWLGSPQRFQLSPDLPLVAGFQARRAQSGSDSIFHGALADTEPDAWGRRLVARAHARARKKQPELGALTELDYLAAVDDFSRVGALRLRDEQGQFLRTSTDGQSATPPLIDLERIHKASQAVEKSEETARDLLYLQGKGTSLGGMRPKCTVLDEQGRLAIGKFPSVTDTRSVTRGEVLALHLARAAGIDAAAARIVEVQGTAVALIQRFDRTPGMGRIPYLSAAAMLQASRDEDRSYTEIADLIRSQCARPTDDLQQLWRRMVFNLLITNVDDHLQNLGFLYEGQGQWRLAPAFDINPFPDKQQESKTWLSPDTGPIDSLPVLLAHAPHFGLVAPGAAEAVLAQVVKAVSGWRAVAQAPAVGLAGNRLNDFAAAFEHPAAQAARQVLGGTNHHENR